MRILMDSPAFHPSTGGVESVATALSLEFVRRGHDVTVVTDTASPGADDFPFEVLRNPSPRALWRAARRSDAVLQMNMNLGNLWALALRPRTVVHHVCGYGEPSFTARLKLFLTRFSDNVCVSEACARTLGIREYRVVHNGYRSDIFAGPKPEPERHGVVFVGRLTDEKGVELLLRAFPRLAAVEQRARLTVIGDGPLRGRLERLAAREGIADRVDFLGEMSPSHVAWQLGRHRVMAVPSRRVEAFGIVALEGLASGCRVLVSDGNGLIEAVGDCGRTFKNGDADSLSDALVKTYLAREDVPQKSLEEHLARHTWERVAEEYLEHLEEICKKSSK